MISWKSPSWSVSSIASIGSWRSETEPSAALPAACVEQRQRELEHVLSFRVAVSRSASVISACSAGFGTSRWKRARPRAARARIASSSAGVAAVSCATTSTSAVRRVPAACAISVDVRCA